MNSEYDLIKVIKEAALEAVRESDPADIHFGTVETTDPKTGAVKSIRVDQQWQIDGDQTVVPHTYQKRIIKKVKVKGSVIGQVRTCLKKLEIDYSLDEGCGDDEALVDVTIEDYLKPGDKVILSREQGGQRFVVSGRTGVADDT